MQAEVLLLLIVFGFGFIMGFMVGRSGRRVDYHTAEMMLWQQEMMREEMRREESGSMLGLLLFIIIVIVVLSIVVAG
jgi:hypothetical protein